MPDKFFTNSLEEFALRQLDIASFCFNSYSKKETFHYMLDIYNKTVILVQGSNPFSIIGVLITKYLFDKIGGYDETIKLSEDKDLGKRAMKFGKFGIIRSTEIFISDRRFQKDGWVSTIMKYILSEIYTLFIGPIRSDIFNYKFDHYNDKK